MKSKILLLALCACTLVSFRLFSQCAGGTAPLTITYDTVVYGNGNASRFFSVPKFNPATGTLLSADIKSTVGLQYSYNLQNQTLLDKIFKTKIVRTDDITSDALDPYSINAVNQTPYVPSLIPGLNSLNYGPANMNYSTANSITDSRLINFMGVGTVDFDYETGTSASVQGPLPWQLNFTSVKDTTHFSVVYRYCAASILSSDLLYFSLATLKDKIMLSWRQANLDLNRNYEVQISTNGQDFSTVTSLHENTIGSYTYVWLNNITCKTYFRIKENNVSGETKYSYTRTVDAIQARQAAVRIYPTLYTGGMLQVSFPDKGDWRINFYSAEGRMIAASQQKDVYSTQLEMPAYISNGIYTAEIINARTQQREVTRIVVQK